MRVLPYAVVDTFTPRPLAGLQLAVFTDPGDIDPPLMQSLATELNVPESIFLFPAVADGHVRVRIFTPAVELPFAGAPVLGCTFVVGKRQLEDVVRIETGLGTVPVALQREGGRVVFGRMQQPIPPWEPYERADDLLAALGVAGSELPVEAYRNGPRHVFVELPTAAAVTAIRPDRTALEDHAIAVNCVAGSGRNWKNRMFAPALGMPEDPATGSAAGPLAVYLARHGRIAWGDEIKISQGAEIRRPSTLYARAVGSAEHIDRVEVGGSAVIVAGGEFRLS